jgi:23S rRNA (guanine745-N1)-methyltransferase
MWQCPLCQQELTLQTDTQPKQWVCCHGHSFDVAKSGYVNLLPVQFKHSRQPGDDKLMVNARRQFHDFKSYEPLMAKLVELIQDYREPSQALHLYDAGCGEGSYLAYCQNALATKYSDLTAAGSDIAKHAVDIGAKKYKACQFSVATSVDLPLPTGSQSILLQVFAPGSSSEYHRVLEDNGLLITVNPGPKHLWQLKQQLYDQPRQHVQNKSEWPGFQLIETQALNYQLKFISPAHCLALLQMTPYYWRLSAQKAEFIQQQLTEIDVSFSISLFQKLANTTPQ